MSAVADRPPVIATSISEYSPTAAGLADLQHRFKDVVFDVTTAKGDKEARAARYELVKLRTGLEAKRKEIKAPALERSRLIDSEAQRIAGAIAELEKPIDDQIRLEEQRKEAEKQAKIDAEARRVADIRERISSFAAVAVRAVGRPVAEVEEKIKLVVAVVRDENAAEFAEFIDEAKTIQTDTLARLREIRDAAVAAEAEAARVVAERAELERLRAEDAERRRAEQVRADAERRAEDERLAAAAREIEARERAQREDQARLDAEAAERRRAADEQAAAVRAEADRQALAEREIARRRQEAEQRRIETERAELQRQQAERDAAEREEREARAMEEGRAREAAAAAEDRLKVAARPMFDALILWRTVDAASRPKNTDAYKQAAAARDAAIALAMGEATLI